MGIPSEIYNDQIWKKFLCSCWSGMEYGNTIRETAGDWPTIIPPPPSDNNIISYGLSIKLLLIKFNLALSPIPPTFFFILQWKIGRSLAGDEIKFNPLPSILLLFCSHCSWLPVVGCEVGGGSWWAIQLQSSTDPSPHSASHEPPLHAVVYRLDYITRIWAKVEYTDL